ncbi:hypothetical protein DXA36_32280 [Eisenbergiella sp. OF01-20]|nr:hypothetical protein DXA36_32280 [Eisenbergiella sp. OF01-20]
MISYGYERKRLSSFGAHCRSRPLFAGGTRPLPPGRRRQGGDSTREGGFKAAADPVRQAGCILAMAIRRSVKAAAFSRPGGMRRAFGGTEGGGASLVTRKGHKITQVRVFTEGGIPL